MMGFSGIRAVVIIVVLVVIVLAVIKFDLPKWLPAVGVVLAAGVLKPREKKTSS
jgi:hypothetical protein